MERVTLVDADDQSIGSCGKIEAHQDGKLHRAFSILITNPDGDFLLQRRAACKYHFAGRWSNACCGHPRPGEETLPAASRRLAEELSVVVSLEPIVELRYRAVDPASGLIEHEYLHVLWGQCSDVPRPNQDEVDAFQWMRPDELERALADHPGRFTPWFGLLVARRYAFPPGSRRVRDPLRPIDGHGPVERGACAGPDTATDSQRPGHESCLAREAASSGGFPND
jgi:isopentenyl-diphosphate delta-isomerase